MTNLVLFHQFFALKWIFFNLLINAKYLQRIHPRTQAQGRVSAASANPYAAQAAALTAAYGQQGLQVVIMMMMIMMTTMLQTSSAKALTQAVNVKFKNLPFYDIHGELLKPTSLVTQGEFIKTFLASYFVPIDHVRIQNSRWWIMNSANGLLWLYKKNKTKSLIGPIGSFQNSSIQCIC